MRQKTEGSMYVRICVRIAVALSLLQQRHRLSSGLRVAMLGELKISEPQVTVTCRTTTYQSQICGAFGDLFGRTALDAMIGDLLVCHVAGLFPGHMAAAAVWLIRVVLADESGLSMAGKTSPSKPGDSLFS